MLNGEQFNVVVRYADGNNWDAPEQMSEIAVLAADEREARLVATQMAYTPQPGKPAHIQITGSEVRQ